MNETLTLTALRAHLATEPRTATVTLLLPSGDTGRFDLETTHQHATIVAQPAAPSWDATVGDVLAAIDNELTLLAAPHAMPVYVCAPDGGLFGVSVESGVALRAVPLIW